MRRLLQKLYLMFAECRGLAQRPEAPFLPRSTSGLLNTASILFGIALRVYEETRERHKGRRAGFLASREFSSLHNEFSPASGMARRKDLNWTTVSRRQVFRS